ncbi:MAG TPA: hypothetical protein VF518_14270, partial [Polyangia bacterium]
MGTTAALTLILCGVVGLGCRGGSGTTGTGTGGNSSSSSSSTRSSGGTTAASSSGGGRSGGSGGYSTNSSSGSAGGSAGSSSTAAGSSGGSSSTSSSGSSSGGTSMAGSTSTGGSAGAGGSSIGSSSAVDPCSNGVQDSGETGVDCGGNCPACPIVYKINPPNQCQNHYFYPNCKSGDASTECAGVCQPRNACENAPGKDGKIQGFACSRYMLFSPMMEQAAKDDGAKLGWSTSDSPFLYAVAGHDTNKDGIDKGMVGNQPCCECYQLIFDQPFNEGGQSNQAPAPKPLVVQSFNIGATSDSFDLYMGAGGFGAFNGCMDNGTIKSSAGFTLYDSYPADGQPGNGGVKFRTYDECRSGNEKITTADAVNSTPCQSKIAGFCN